MEHTQDTDSFRPDSDAISKSFLGLDFAKYLLSSDNKRFEMESDQTTESDRSDFSDGEMERFSHTFIPGNRAGETSEDSDEYGIYYGERSKYPQMFDTNIDSGATGNLFHSMKQQSECIDDNQNNNSQHIDSIITKLNSSFPDSAYGTGHSLYAINESGSTVTETSESDSNSEGTISNSGSPVHNPVYGRYQKLSTHSKTHAPSPETPADNSHEMLILHRLPGENLGMILGIEGGKDSFGKVSSVSVKSVTLGGAAYRATGGQKGVCVGDEIMTVNGTNLLSLTHDECISVFKDMPLRVQLSIKRGQKNLPAVAISPLHFERKRELKIRRDISDSEDEALGGFAIYQVDIVKHPAENLGLSIVPSYGSTKEFYQIKRILPSGAAARSTQLRVGDRLITCNGQHLQGLTQNHCLNILRTESSYGDIQLEVVRPIDNGSSMEISVTLNNSSQLPGFDPAQYSVKSQSYDRHADVIVTSESEDYLTVSEDEYSRSRLADIPEVDANEVFSNNNFKLAYQSQFNTIKEDTTETETETDDCQKENHIPSDVDVVDLNIISSPYHIPKEQHNRNLAADRSTLKSGDSVASSNIDNISIGSSSSQRVSTTDLDAVSLESAYSLRPELPSTELDTVSIGSAYQNPRQQVPATELDSISIDSRNSLTNPQPVTDIDSVSIGSSNNTVITNIDTVGLTLNYKDIIASKRQLSPTPRQALPATDLDTVSVSSRNSIDSSQREPVPFIDVDSISVYSGTKDIFNTDSDTGSLTSSYKNASVNRRQLSPVPSLNLPATDRDTVSVSSINTDNDTVSSNYNYSVPDQREFSPNPRQNLPATDLDTVSLSSRSSTSVSSTQQGPVPFIGIDSVSLPSTYRDNETISLRSSYKDTAANRSRFSPSPIQNLPATDLDTVSLSSRSSTGESSLQQGSVPYIGIDSVRLPSTYRDNDTISLGSNYKDSVVNQRQFSPSPIQNLPATDLDNVSLSSRSSTTTARQGHIPAVDIETTSIQPGNQDIVIPDTVSSDYKNPKASPRLFVHKYRHNVPPTDIDTVGYTITSLQQQQTPATNINSISLDSTSFKSDAIVTEAVPLNINTSYKDSVPNLRQLSPRQYYSKPQRNLFTATPYDNQNIETLNSKPSKRQDVAAAPPQVVDGDMEIALPPPVEFSDILTEPTSNVYITDDLESDPDTFTFVSDADQSNTPFVDITPVHQNIEVIESEDQIPTKELLQLEASFRALEEEASPDNYLDSFQELNSPEEIPYESISSSDSKLSQCYEVIAPIQSVYKEHEISFQDSFNVPAEFADGDDEILQVIQSHDNNTILISQFVTRETRQTADSPIMAESDYYKFTSAMDKNSEAMLKDALDLEYEMLPDSSKFQTRIELGANLENEMSESIEENPVAESIAHEMVQNETGGYGYYMESDDEPDKFPTADLPENNSDLPDWAPPDLPDAPAPYDSSQMDIEILTATKGLDVKLVPSNSASAVTAQHKDGGASHQSAEMNPTWSFQISEKHNDGTVQVFNNNISDITRISPRHDETEQTIVPAKIERKVEIPVKLFQHVSDPETIVPVQVNRKFEIPVKFKEHFPEKQAEISAPVPETMIQSRPIVTVTTKFKRPAVPPKPLPRKLQDSQDDKPIAPPKPSPRRTQDPLNSFNKHIATISIDTTDKFGGQDPVKEDILLPTNVTKKESQVTINFKEPEPIEDTITPTVIVKDRNVNNVIHLVNSMKDGINDENRVTIIPVESDNQFNQTNNNESFSESVRMKQAISTSNVQNQANSGSPTVKRTIVSTNDGRCVFPNANVLSPPKQDIIITCKETIRKPMSSTFPNQDGVIKDCLHKTSSEGNVTHASNDSEPRKAPLEILTSIPVKQAKASDDSHVKKSIRKSDPLDIGENTVPRLNLGSINSNSESLSPSSEGSADLFTDTAFKTTLEVTNTESEKPNVEHRAQPPSPLSPVGLIDGVFTTTLDVSNSDLKKPVSAHKGEIHHSDPTSPRSPCELTGAAFKTTIDVKNSESEKPTSPTNVEHHVQPTLPLSPDGLASEAFKTTINVATLEPETTSLPPAPEKHSLAPTPLIKPISLIQPRSFNPKSLSQNTRVQYKTTISTLDMKPTGWSTLGRSSLMNPPKVDHPIKRMETLPFEVSILKGILGIGIKTTMTPEGLVKVTEILPSGPVGREGNIKVGDYLLSINSADLTVLPDSKVQQILRLLPRGLSKIVASAVPPEANSSTSKPVNKEIVDKKSLSPRQSVPLPAPRQLTISTAPKPLLLSNRPVSSTKSVPSPSQRQINKTESAVVSPRSQVDSVSPLVSPRSPLQENTSPRTPPPVAPKPKRSSQTSDILSNTSNKAQPVKTDYVMSTGRDEKSSRVPIVPQNISSKSSDYVTSARKTSPRDSNPVRKDIAKNSEDVKGGPIETEIFVSIKGPRDEHIPQQQTGSIVLPGSVKYDSVESKVERVWTPGVVSSANGQPMKTKDILIPIVPGKINVVESMPSFTNTDDNVKHDDTKTHEHAPVDSLESVDVVANTDDEKSHKFSFKASFDSDFEFDTSPTRKPRSMSTSSESSYTEFTECNVEDNVIPEQIDEELDSDVDTQLDIGADNQTSKCVPKLNYDSEISNIVVKPDAHLSTIVVVDSQDTMSRLNVGHGLNDENVSTASYEEDFDTDDDLNANLEGAMMDSVEDVCTPMMQKVAEDIVANVFSSITPSDLIGKNSIDIQAGDVDDSVTDDSSDNEGTCDDNGSSDGTGDDDECPPPVPSSPPPLPTSEVPELFETELPITRMKPPSTALSIDVVSTDDSTNFTYVAAPSPTSKYVVVSDYTENVHFAPTNETYVHDDIIEVSHYEQAHAKFPVTRIDTDSKDIKQKNVSDSVIIQEEDVPKESNSENRNLDGSVKDRYIIDENDNDESISAVISLYSNIEKSLCTEDEDAFQVYVPGPESNTYQHMIASPYAKLEKTKTGVHTSDNQPVHSGLRVNVKSTFDETDSCDTKSITSSEDLVSDSDATDSHVYTHSDSHVHVTEKVEPSATKGYVPAKLTDINGGDLNGHGMGVTGTVAISAAVTTPISPVFSDTSIGADDVKPGGKYSIEADRMIRLMSTDDEPSMKGDGEIIIVKMNKGVTGVGFVIQGGKASPKGDLPISIRRLFRGGPAEQCGQLKVKDELLDVNGEDFTTMRHSEAWQHLKFLPSGEILMKIRRYTE